MPTEEGSQARTWGITAASFLVVSFVLWGLFGSAPEQRATDLERDIERQVAGDMIEQYNIAARNGTAVDRCVHAGIVAAAFLQANDEANYARWKSREEADCAAAGVPR